MLVSRNWQIILFNGTAASIESMHGCLEMRLLQDLFVVRMYCNKGARACPSGFYATAVGCVGEGAQIPGYG
ncbi:hypothetical protein QQP08_008250 [Theobroma cacao]|nr:hypothetical protein QQP08_008250 [Theobroma cacao]